LKFNITVSPISNSNIPEIFEGTEFVQDSAFGIRSKQVSLGGSGYGMDG
jgi:hypothetical protein